MLPGSASGQADEALAAVEEVAARALRQDQLRGARVLFLPDQAGSREVSGFRTAARVNAVVRGLGGTVSVCYRAKGSCDVANASLIMPRTIIRDTTATVAFTIGRNNNAESYRYELRRRSSSGWEVTKRVFLSRT